MQAPTTTHLTRYPKMLIFGLQGIGKSSIGAEMPSPVFIQTTDGLEGLGVEAFPIATKAQDVRDALNWLLTEKHSFKTVVIDTVGWLEKLIHLECCAELNLQFMTQSSVKSYPLAKQKLFDIKEQWDRLNTERKMLVLLIGHASIEKFEDPTTSSYDRYQLDMNDKCAAMLLQDCDIVGFMNQKVAIREEKDGWDKSVKAAGANRYLFFDPRPAYYAKQHGYDLPAEMLAEKGTTWQAMWNIMKPKFMPAKKPNLKAVVEDKVVKSLDKSVVNGTVGMGTKNKEAENLAKEEVKLAESKKHPPVPPN